LRSRRRSKVDRTGEPDYKPALPSRLRLGSAQVAQLVEHATENRSVGGSIPPLGTIKINYLGNISHFIKSPCPHCVRVNVVGQSAPTVHHRLMTLSRIHRVPIRCVTRSKWPRRRTVWRKAAPTRPPKPTAAASAERLQRSVRIKDLEADAGPRVDVEERLALSGVGGGRHHAAFSAGSARAKPRR
jgi:hypothetical protein